MQSGWDAADGEEGRKLGRETKDMGGHEVGKKRAGATSLSLPSSIEICILYT
jgi:hypothetical protein